MALHGGREGETTPTDLSLFIPTVKLSSILYHPYAIGLTTLILTVLIAGLAWKRRGERILDLEHDPDSDDSVSFLICSMADCTSGTRF